LLTDCHRRIEKFLDALAMVAIQSEGEKLTNEQREAVEVCLLYFKEAAPKHTADEEESLFPRMLAKRNEEVEESRSSLAQLHSDHRLAEEAHRTLDELFRRWLLDVVLSVPDANRLISTLTSLRETYARHIKEEEEQIFPLAARLLTPSDFCDLASEMAKRRGLAFVSTE
jgi:hemerythrin-like domain-containing protein